MDDVIRIGNVSSVNGTTVRVTYPDRQDAVTAELPLVGNGVYRVPKVGETVLVVHCSNDVGRGVCVGGMAAAGLDQELTALLERIKEDEDRIKALEERL